MSRDGRRDVLVPLVLSVLWSMLLAVSACVAEDGDEAAETVVRETVVEEDGREVVAEEDGYHIRVDDEDGTVEIDEEGIDVDIDVDTDDDPPGRATEPPGRARGHDKDGVDDDG